MRYFMFLMGLIGCMRASWAQHFIETSADTKPIPQFGVELRVAPYQPRVGNQQEQQAYRLMYTSSKDHSIIKNHPLMWSAEFDWYFFNTFGKLGLLGRVGYWNVRAKTRACKNDDGSIAQCTSDTVAGSSKGNDTQTLTIVPVSAGLVYRLDALQAYYRIPIIFSAKAAADYYFWNNKVGNKISTRKEPRLRGQGGTWGFHTAAGMAISLNFLEPTSAARARNASGIADTQIFAEYTWLFANQFNNSKKFDMSDKQLVMGLRFDLY